MFHVDITIYILLTYINTFIAKGALQSDQSINILFRRESFVRWTFLWLIFVYIDNFLVQVPSFWPDALFQHHCARFTWPKSRRALLYVHEEYGISALFVRSRCEGRVHRRVQKIPKERRKSFALLWDCGTIMSLTTHRDKLHRHGWLLYNEASNRITGMRQETEQFWWERSHQKMWTFVMEQYEPVWMHEIVGRVRNQTGTKTITKMIWLFLVR